MQLHLIQPFFQRSEVCTVQDHMTDNWRTCSRSPHSNCLGQDFNPLSALQAERSNQLSTQWNSLKGQRARNNCFL